MKKALPTTKKCKCGRRFKLHSWHNAFERTTCFTCRVKIKTALEMYFEPRVKDIILFRFGFSPDHQTHTLEETGQKFGVSRERIRQIEANAMARLKAINLL